MVMASAVAVAAFVLGVLEPAKTLRACPHRGSVLSLAAAAHSPNAPMPQLQAKPLAGTAGHGHELRGPGLMLDAEKTNVVSEILIIERVSVENWSAFGELKIKTKTLLQADFPMHNSWSRRPRRADTFSVCGPLGCRPGHLQVPDSLRGLGRGIPGSK